MMKLEKLFYQVLENMKGMEYRIRLEGVNMEEHIKTLLQMRKEKLEQIN